MKKFGGQPLFLDRNDINTDEIIPAKYLTENSKEALKPHILEDLHLEDFDAGKDITGKSIIVTKANFGCGSSREHAVWVFEVNDINVVIAESFARIFRQNMFNCGMLAIELPREDIDTLFTLGTDAVVRVDLEQNKILLLKAARARK
jgi:3-isopropylmalate/(R)-2-methylmalate dehydratase small subunit